MLSYLFLLFRSHSLRQLQYKNIWKWEVKNYDEIIPLFEISRFHYLHFAFPMFYTQWHTNIKLKFLIKNNLKTINYFFRNVQKHHWLLWLWVFLEYCKAEIITCALFTFIGRLFYNVNKSLKILKVLNFEGLLISK